MGVFKKTSQTHKNTKAMKKSSTNTDTASLSLLTVTAETCFKQRHSKVHTNPAEVLYLVRYNPPE